MKQIMITPIENTQFYEDLTDKQREMNVNGNPMPLGIWNLIMHKRDIGYWKIGVKPNGSFDFDQVKEYYGIVQGGIPQVEEYLQWIWNVMNGIKCENPKWMRISEKEEEERK